MNSNYYRKISVNPFFRFLSVRIYSHSMSHTRTCEMISKQRRILSLFALKFIFFSISWQKYLPSYAFEICIQNGIKSLIIQLEQGKIGLKLY